MATIGNVFLGLAFISSLVAIGALFWGHRLGKEGEGVTNFGYLATFAALAFLSLDMVIMISAMFRSDFTFLYVAENHTTDVSSLKWLYTLSAVWAGREGSLLFWTWVLSLFAGWVAYKRLQFTDAISNMGLAVTNIVLALFGAAMLFSNPNNPFKRVGVLADGTLTDPNNVTAAGALLQNGVPMNVNGMGMNPLLQHWAMILHPPTLFIGYAGLTIPFAFAIAAIIVNDGSRKWVDITNRITVFAWLFLGAGIGLGAVWAYVVLGWGGYWAWDPVENASLLPWLTGVGLLHSFTVYRRRDGFKKWAVVMAGVTFALVILGTFITRSGIVQSVHAFQQDPVSLYLFLSMIIGSVAAAVIGVLWRGDTFKGNDDFESLTSKEAAYYFNNVLMLLSAIIVAYLTVTSALPQWLPGGGQTFAARTYDAVARPVGILYVLIMAVCPLLSWGKTPGATMWQRLRWPLVTTAVLFGLLVWDYLRSLRPIFDKLLTMAAQGQKTPVSLVGPPWWHEAQAIVGFLVAALAISTSVWLFIDGARKRASAKGEGFGTALWAIMSKARTQTGGYMTHLGIGIILVGLIGSSMFVNDIQVKVDAKDGSQFKVDRYTFVYKGIQDTTLPNGDQTATTKFQILKDGKPAGEIDPGQTSFAAQGQTRLNAAVKSEALRDIFVVFQGMEDNKLSMNVKINPLISFAWIGFALMLLGTTIAVWPKREVMREVGPAAGAKR